ncbi:uncharacterized protein LOC136029166 [Artemia franciscana]|uniref:C2H2-type domain-containing protein n=1 Tax=Artemia franciscana TaxID=6661 RepID=A0AA88H8H1_ARTSF|nr:hypothetical protein QYM36_015110 [Artemia franciscana]KAK2707305.1 hypothetical protein QYM36_015110 [Artemia franciscana]KAK2707306.1 hypothetical protein QYM36_015110 [Artemia franciscana]
MHPSYQMFPPFTKVEPTLLVHSALSENIAPSGENYVEPVRIERVVSPPPPPVISGHKYHSRTKDYRSLRYGRSRSRTRSRSRSRHVSRSRSRSPRSRFVARSNSRSPSYKRRSRSPRYDKKSVSPASRPRSRNIGHTFKSKSRSRSRNIHRLSRSRSRSSSKTPKKKSKDKKKKKKRSRISSSSEKSRSPSPPFDYAKWMDIIKNIDSSEAASSVAKALPPFVIKKLTGAGLWPVPVSFDMSHTGSEKAILQTKDSLEQDSPLSSSAIASGSTSKEVKREIKLEAPSLTQDQRIMLLHKRDKFTKAGYTLTGEILQLQSSRSELFGRMLTVSDNEDISHYQNLITENLKLKNELMSRVKEVNKAVVKCNDTLGIPSEKEFLSLNVKYFDPKNHFCCDCKSLFESATEYLYHLKMSSHKKLYKRTKDRPWCEGNANIDGKELQDFDKTVPFEGMPFILPVDAFYCKLCDIWSGDKESTLQHLSSKAHNNKYLEFSMKNPDWEMEYIHRCQKVAKAISKSKFELRMKNKTLDDETSSAACDMEISDSDDSGSEVRTVRISEIRSDSSSRGRSESSLREVKLHAYKEKDPNSVKKINNSATNRSASSKKSDNNASSSLKATETHLGESNPQKAVTDNNKSLKPFFIGKMPALKAKEKKVNEPVAK